MKKSSKRFMTLIERTKSLFYHVFLFNPTSQTLVFVIIFYLLSFPAKTSFLRKEILCDNFAKKKKRS